MKRSLFFLAFLQGAADGKESPNGEAGGDDAIGDEHDNLPNRQTVAGDIRRFLRLTQGKVKKSWQSCGRIFLSFPKLERFLPKMQDSGRKPRESHHCSFHGKSAGFRRRS